MLRWLGLLLIIAAMVIFFFQNRQDVLLDEIPDSYRISGFPTYQQPDYISCGSTSLKMLLEYYGDMISLEDIKLKTKNTWLTWKGKEFGMSAPIGIKGAAEYFRLKTSFRRGNIDLVKNYIAQNRPPIILMRSGELTWHYVVAIGYDESFVTVADPSPGGIWNMPIDHFVSAWAFTHDMGGEKMENELILQILNGIDVYNFTMIVPQEPHK